MKKFENILVAFDLNKTLFYKSESPLPRVHDKKIKKLYFYLRPHIKQLVDFLHSHQINYCFWSNMMLKNCKKYVNELESFGMKRHCGIFGQDFCDRPQNVPEDTEKVKSVKNLNKLANLFQIDVQHCVLVDDSKEKNVQGCHLIHINSFEGSQEDKQIFYIIERIKEFRKGRVNEQRKSLHILKLIEYTQFGSIQSQDAPSIPKPKQQKKQIQPKKSIFDLQIDNQLFIQFKKFKKDLVAQKQTKKSLKKEIEALQKSIFEMGQQIKKQSEGKTVKKGDELLLQVLTFAKHKKASEKKLQQLEVKKRLSQQKISIIKKLMRDMAIKLNINEDELKQDLKNHQNQQQTCPQAKKKKNKKHKKKDKKQEDDQTEVPVQGDKGAQQSNKETQKAQN